MSPTKLIVKDTSLVRESRLQNQTKPLPEGEGIAEPER
jgi:hypothetical protein